MAKNKQKHLENEAHKHPNHGAMYKPYWPTDHPCAGITLRVQSYDACHTNHKHRCFTNSYVCRAISFHQVHGSPRRFECGKMYRLRRVLSNIVKNNQKDLEQSQPKDRFAIHMFRAGGASYHRAWVLAASGKQSTWLPLGGLVEQNKPTGQEYIQFIVKYNI